MELKFEQPKFYQYALVESRGIYHRVRALFDSVGAQEKNHARQPNLIPVELIYCHFPGDYILTIHNGKEQPSNCIDQKCDADNCTIPEHRPDPTGTGWTQWKSIADAINRSHACNGGMVVLVTNDGEDFIALSAELAGIAEDQTQVNDNVYEYRHAGDFSANDPSPGWAIQLTLV